MTENNSNFASDYAGSVVNQEIQILFAKVIRDFALLVFFEDGKRIIYDFRIYALEERFKKNKVLFKDFELSSNGIVWGVESISAKEIYETGIDLDYVETIA
jgi:hypothetical protein